MTNEIILVEDNKHKAIRIIDLIKNIDDSFNVTEACSFTSGWQLITKTPYDLIILDMSLPTYDRSDSESGGKFRTLGGLELARKITRRKMDTKFVFITQYESFSDIGGVQSLDSLREELVNQYEDQCLGVIFFDTSSVLWKKNLTYIIQNLFLEQ